MPTFIVHVIRESDGRDDAVPFLTRAAAERYAAKVRAIINPGFTITIEETS